MKQIAQLTTLFGIGPALLLLLTLSERVQAQSGPGTALSFAGTGDMLVISGTPLPVPWTAEFWVNRQDSPSYSSALLGDTSTALKLEQFDFTRKVGITQFGVADYPFNYTAPVDTWVHLAFVGTATNTQLYVNGMLRDSLAVSLPLGLEQLGSDSAGDRLKGTIDEVRVWSVARSPIDILANMNRSLSLPQPNLISYWKFDEATGTNAFDASGNGHTAALINGPVWVTSTVPFLSVVTNLPVYQVVQSGATPMQTTVLAQALGIATNQLLFTNGAVSFLSTNFLRPPMKPITDPAVISNLLSQTVNKYPSIPIRFEQVDLAALTNMPVMSSDQAINLVSNALFAAWLIPQSLYGGGLVAGTPAARNTTFVQTLTNGAQAVTVEHALDTEVSYIMYSSNGVPFVGPGMQAQAAFDGNGNVTRLYYSAAQLEASASATIFSINEASNRAALLLNPSGAGQCVITPTLVYYVPMFHWTNPCVQCPPLATTNFVLPYYECTGTITETNPVTGLVTQMHLTGVTIPATDDARFVPQAATLTASESNGQVFASVSVSGGQPPYSYVWRSSSPPTLTSNGASILYTPMVRVAPPRLQLTLTNTNSVTLSWHEPNGPLWQVESATNLLVGRQAWSPPAASIISNLDLYTATLSRSEVSTFFRLVLTATNVSRVEHIGVNIIDANGVSVQTNLTMPVAATPWLPDPNPPPDSTPKWGGEGPYDEFGPDLAGWRAGMETRGAGGGVESFCWLGRRHGRETSSSRRCPARFPTNPGSMATLITATGASTRPILSFTPAMVTQQRSASRIRKRPTSRFGGVC